MIYITLVYNLSNACDAIEFAVQIVDKSTT